MATTVGPVRPSQALRQRRESQRPNLNRNMSRSTLADASAALNRIMEDMPFGTCDTVASSAVPSAAKATTDPYTDRTHSPNDGVHPEQVQGIAPFAHHTSPSEPFPSRPASGDLPLRFAHERTSQTYQAENSTPQHDGGILLGKCAIL